MVRDVDEDNLYTEVEIQSAKTKGTEIRVPDLSEILAHPSLPQILPLEPSLHNILILTSLPPSIPTELDLCQTSWPYRNVNVALKRMSELSVGGLPLLCLS